MAQALPFQKWSLPLKLSNFQKITIKRTTKSKLKIGPILLRNKLGPVFNFDLGQFLTLKFCYYLFLSVVGAETLFYSVFSETYKK